MNNDNIQQTWGIPALFNAADASCCYLIHEADLNSSYCGKKLSNVDNKSKYKLTFPDPGEGDGEPQPTITLPWKSPWRVIIIGGLADIVESTLIDDVSTPSLITKTDWIKPGVVSWNYWSSNHGTKDFKIVSEFADLAAEMGWPYTLIDWEWDQMSNGGNLEDAAQFEIMVYFHGCIVPRGWARTYPHLMTYEAIRGAEWNNNGPEFIYQVPEHNATALFTRNVVGSMDYTPVTFTNSQISHITSYGHELALSVLFESGMQHMADRSEGYQGLPDAAKTFLKEVPNAWDDTRLIDVYPEKIL